MKKTCTIVLCDSDLNPVYTAVIAAEQCDAHPTGYTLPVTMAYKGELYGRCDEDSEDGRPVYSQYVYDDGVITLTDEQVKPV